VDTIYSRKLGFLDPQSAERVLRALEALGFDLFANELLHVDANNSLLVLEGLEEFREHLGGELTVTLLKAIGQGFEVHEMNLPKVIEAIYELQERKQKGVQKIVSLKG
jgi:3-dehydroquinate synthase